MTKIPACGQEGAPLFLETAVIQGGCVECFTRYQSHCLSVYSCDSIESPETGRGRDSSLSYAHTACHTYPGNVELTEEKEKNLSKSHIKVNGREERGSQSGKS